MLLVYKYSILDMVDVSVASSLYHELKEKAFSVLESYGLTPSQAINLFLN